MRGEQIWKSVFSSHYFLFTTKNCSFFWNGNKFWKPFFSIEYYCSPLNCSNLENLNLRDIVLHNLLYFLMFLEVNFFDSFPGSSISTLKKQIESWKRSTHYEKESRSKHEEEAITMLQTVSWVDADTVGVSAFCSVWIFIVRRQNVCWFMLQQ